MKFGVVVFPGSNCDDDIVYALQTLLGAEVVKLWHKDTSLQNADFIILPGGFSYGDYLRSGAIAQFSPIMKKVSEHAKDGGFLLGICNGFQILTESGLLPGALLRNSGQLFICDNYHIKPENYRTAITSELDLNRAYKIPIAHAEGRFYADNYTLDSLEANRQVIFKYSDAAGNITPVANPNGSERNIAGVCNLEGNVMGLMPHPERAADKYLNNTDGYHLLASLLNALPITVAR